jgi:hypothetical protein
MDDKLTFHGIPVKYVENLDEVPAGSPRYYFTAVPSGMEPELLAFAERLFKTYGMSDEDFEQWLAS